MRIVYLLAKIIVMSLHMFAFLKQKPRFPFNVKIGFLPRSFYSVITDIIAPRRGHKGFPSRIFLEKTPYNRIGGSHFTR